MTSAWTVLFLGTVAVAQAQDVPVYYDYVEDGALRGGVFWVDTSDARSRRILGLDDGLAVAGGWAVTTVVDNGSGDNRIDLVIVGDGYTTTELGAYANQVDNVVAQFFAEEPFAAYASYFNVHRVDVISAESGVDEIDQGVFLDTALDMEYGCFGINRLLCINVGKAQAAAGFAPAVEQILALANSTRYGGAGYPSSNLGTLAGNNSAAVEIALHEFGHSFAELADEYDYGEGPVYSGPEPIEANVTIYEAVTLAIDQRKWFRWLDLAWVDAFEGASYNEFGIYRPTANSKMRSLNRPFEEVNVEQFVLNMYQIVSPIDDATPVLATPYPPDQWFSVVPLQPMDHGLDIQWSIDGADVAGATATSFQADVGALSGGIHTITVRVVDPTSRVRDEGARQTWMADERTWEIDVPCDAVPPNAMQPDPADVAMNRYLALPVSSAAIDPGTEYALRVTLVGLDGFPSLDGDVRWVGPPAEYVEPTTGGVFSASSLRCDPYANDWSTVALLYVFGSEVIPRSSYAVSLADECCAQQGDESCFSDPLNLSTAFWGDIVAPFGEPVDFGDISAVVYSFQSKPDAPIKARAQLQPNVPVPDNNVSFQDIDGCVSAFKGRPYTLLFAGPGGCP